MLRDEELRDDVTLLKVVNEVKGRNETSFGSAKPMSNTLYLSPGLVLD